jgi:hypothetical protein
LRITIQRSIFAVAIAAAVFAGNVSTQAADLGPGYRYGGRHLGPTGRFSHWRDRCAWAGYYCLYAWDGYVYHYPFDDRASAYGGYRRYRHRS